MIKNKRILCDRQQFIDCANGDLMTRNEKGQITQLGDGAFNALEASIRGETVFLTVDGEIVSKIENYQEIAIKKESFNTK